MTTLLKGRLLVVGPAQSFAYLFERMETHGYRFESVPDTKAADSYLLREKPDAVLLSLPSGEPDCQVALAWMRRTKEELPVVVISFQAGMRPYLAAMECGAFDYITSYTPIAEMERVLATAVRWCGQHQAA